MLTDFIPLVYVFFALHWRIRTYSCCTLTTAVITRSYMAFIVHIHLLFRTWVYTESYLTCDKILEMSVAVF